MIVERSGLNGRLCPEIREGHPRVDMVICGLCGTEMKVTRDRWGPTSYAEGMGGHGHAYDDFECPHLHEPWHKKAESLVRHGNESPCSAIREMHLVEANRILWANVQRSYERDPEFEKYWELPFQGETTKKEYYQLQHRLQDSGWENMRCSYGEVQDAVKAALACSFNALNGMVRVVQGDRVVVEFPAGGYQ